MTRHPELWGYAGVFPGAYGVYDGDVALNKVRFIAEHGFRSIGVDFDLFADPERAAAVDALIARHDLRLTLHLRLPFFTTDAKALAEAQATFRQQLEAAHERARCPLVTFGVGPYHRFMRDPSLASQLDWLAEHLQAPAAFCAERGCPLAIENHGDYYTRDLVELCQRVEGLGIFLDTGNCFLVGEEPGPACRLAAPHTFGTHLKDHFVAPDPSTLSFRLDGAALGDGDVGLRAIYADLLAHHPDPMRLVMQIELVPPRDGDPWEALDRTKSFLHSLTSTAETPTHD